MVRIKGVEPPRLAAPDPKSGASANSAISALTMNIIAQIFNLSIKFSDFFIYFHFNFIKHLIFIANFSITKF